MPSDLDYLRTFKTNLLIALSTWTGSGLKEATVSTGVGTSVTYRSLTELKDALKGVNELIAAESPDVVISRGR